MLNFINSLNIRNRLLGGFGVLTLVLAIAVIITITFVSSNSTSVERIVNLRVPTSQASMSMINNINASLASLRGWMLTGNETFKTERHAVWADIDVQKANMDRLSQTWTNPENVRVWSEFKDTLAEFKIAQQQVEDIANGADEQPAMKILLNDAAPRAAIMLQKITEIIDIEATLEATPARKNLLGMMADIRGTTAVGLANIRAMLLTGDKNFQELYEGTLAKNIRRFGDLENNINLLNRAQRAAFEEFKAERAEFLNYPPQMFEIRSSNQWNMANYLLISEAAPRAGKLLTALAGPKAADGTRTGGMVDNQKGLLNNDAVALQSDISFLQTAEWVILFLGIGIAAIVALRTAGAISTPVNNITETMISLADGNNDVEIPHTENQDEIGQMARRVEIFKTNAIERIALEQKARETQERAEQNKRDQEEQAERNRLEMEEKAREAKLKMADDFENQVSGVIEMITSAASELEATASTMSHLAENTQTQSTDASSATEQASSNVQSVASSSEEMSSSVQEINRQVVVSTEVNEKAVKEAQSTSEIVGDLSNTALKIGDVVEFITDIASQTNLLALNATIEAARAGDAGKGFAVVASEVKDLANQTAKATEEIAIQINSVQNGASKANKAMENIHGVINQTMEVSNSIASAMEEQSAAISEISRSAQEAATGTEIVFQTVDNVSKGSVETKAASDQVLSAAQELAKNGVMMKSVVEDFLNGVRAA